MKRTVVSRRSLARLLGAELCLIVVLSCGGDDRSLPTQGLSPEQARSARFVEKELVLDLRFQDAETRSISAMHLESESFRLHDGWFIAERSGRWAVGDRASLSVNVADPAGLHLYLQSRGLEVETVHVMVNGLEVGLVRPGPEWRSHAARLPPGVLRAGENEIAFVFDFPADRPPFRMIEGDPAMMIREMFGRRRPSVSNLQATLPRIRQVFPGASVHGTQILNLPGIDVADVIGNLNDEGLGTAWQWVSVGGGALAAGFRTIALVENPESFEPETRLAAFSRDRGELTVSRSGQLYVPIEPAGPGRTLSFSASTAAGIGQSTELRLAFEADGGSRALAETTLDGLWGSQRIRSEIALDPLWGPGCLVVDVGLSPASSPLSLETIQIIEDPPAPAVTPRGATDAPDIVLIILDAARADSFGSYGYDRDTTPNIDTLAAESLVFENAYATAPYTSASMPTMLTGLSFHDHGVVGSTNYLDESITTLAEFLQQDGYRTSCYSANPNNAVARGLGQGCDVFEEFWRNARQQRRIDPYRVSASAIARLGEPSEAPEFLMLHYVPPHEPYRPATGFDVFGDPNYKGDYDGSRDTVLAIDTGRLHPTPADMAEVVSLYDGNLLTGDDAVNQVLEALRQRERWDNTVVLVVSDHGEAFGEHGKMSHNSTVYAEMLRIPFILRLPGGVVPETDTTGLVSLEDRGAYAVGSCGN